MRYYDVRKKAWMQKAHHSSVPMVNCWSTNVVINIVAFPPASLPLSLCLSHTHTHTTSQPPPLLATPTFLSYPLSPWPSFCGAFHQPMSPNFPHPWSLYTCAGTNKKSKCSNDPNSLVLSNSLHMGLVLYIPVLCRTVSINENVITIAVMATLLLLYKSCLYSDVIFIWNLINATLFKPLARGPE